MALDTFKVEPIGSPTIYANGRHQCKVCITIRKPKATPLTKAEIASITLRPVSEKLFPKMPAGWRCDEDSNDYDQGAPFVTSIAAKKPSNDAPTLVYRYLSFDQSVAGSKMEPCTFMACVELKSGDRFSTHFTKGAAQFEDTFTIAPKASYALRVKELIAGTSQVKIGSKVEGTVYYWELPEGLTVREEKFAGGLQSTEKLQYFYGAHSALAFNLNNDLIVHFAVSRKVNRLTLEDIGFYQSEGVDPKAVFGPLGDNTRLRAVRYHLRWSADLPQAYRGDERLQWTITDSRGCVSNFVVKTDGDKIVLTDL